MSTLKKNIKSAPRVSYSYAEFAELVGKEKTWVYRQVAKRRLRSITGFGYGMIPASEVQRIFGQVEG